MEIEIEIQIKQTPATATAAEIGGEETGLIIKLPFPFGIQFNNRFH